jgi:uncharacterized membrane protein
MAREDDRRGLALRRVVSAFAAGAVVLVVTVLVGGGWTVGLSSAWLAAALVLSARIWLRIWKMSPPQTAKHAQAEDYSRPLADLVVLAASVASLLAIGFTLVDARNHSGTTKGLLIALAVAVVAFSWLTVHLVFTVRYGDLYYGDPVGGIDFKEDGAAPDYRDFLYIAFTIGMTFQVSDTDITAKPMRRQALRHALLSFLFGAVIVAMAINTVASLLQ